MKNNILASAISTILITSALTACGGGGSTDAAGISGTAVTSSGSISEFGSVFVNGVRYETTSAKLISVDDDNNVLLTNPTNAELQARIGLGQVVTVRGTRTDDSNGIATTISFDNELAGEVSSVSVDDASFVILGQTISITPETIIDDSLIEAVRGTEIPNDLKFGDLLISDTLDLLLPTGTVIVVSGFPSQNGFEAARIEGGAQVGGGTPGFEAEVKGTVRNLTPTQFELNGLTVLYDNSVLDSEDFSNTSLEDGMFVEVHGSANSATQITAARIEREDNLLDDDFSEGELELEGVVQKIMPDSTGTGGIITINGIDIRVDDVSQFSEGLRIEIKGRLQSDGSFSITRIKDEQEDNVRIEDIAVSEDGTSFTTRLGLVITPTNRSRLEDDTIEDDDNLSIASFLTNVNGERVEARGFPLNADIAWTRIEISKDDDTDCRLRGPVDTSSITGDASSFTFSIEGVTINVSNISSNNFKDSNNLSIGKATFFNELDEGDIVQANSDKAGTGCNTGELTAREVEFEPEDSVLLSTSDDSSNNSSNDGSNNSNDNELVGSVSNITATSFDLAGETITVNAATIIDDSIIEDARGVEVNNEESFGDLSETLAQLLSDGMGLEVVVDRSNGIVAVSIEDL
ncbi:MAG: hypothetical protein HOM14_02500 [Gammaproteobacteria bacterium]|jgi:hypothetical protein|nr:hypothetical protein [Gammaproteobacteria bacterium]MBT3725731.1 hypothetical protein [Gammaproteobacteria bacterium]MBT4075654.1 hypothetical protein [Gammaproteobacteria bacterium]MBT4195487.1 hypothetical protein [Gammaproteobacteria bacterium]MBT4448791.1 hypothetical protein [Gammaproteobacteria bacterium]